MSGAPSPRPSSGPSPAQLRYARLLDWGMKAGLAALIAGFALYLTGVLSPVVAFEDLPRLWVLPVAEYVRASGMPTGWDWLAVAGKGDVAATIGIAMLSGISILCLVALMPLYARNRDWPYLIVAGLLAGVLAAAASGVLVAH